MGLGLTSNPLSIFLSLFTAHGTPWSPGSPLMHTLINFKTLFSLIVEWENAQWEDPQ